MIVFAVAVFSTLGLAAIVVVREGLNPSTKSLLQGLTVTAMTVLVTFGYIHLSEDRQEPLTFIDKFWISLPFLASFVVSGRCIVGRLFRLVIRKKRRE